MTDHPPGQVRRLIHYAARHAQVCRVRKLSLVSHHRGDFVSARKRCSENALAGVAGGAEEKDFHNRTSSFITQVLTLHGSARPSSASPRRGNVRSRTQCPLYPQKRTGSEAEAPTFRSGLRLPLRCKGANQNNAPATQ